jgi:hypothetical protein
MMKGTSALCEWCNTSFQPRRGGSPQRFCASKCRTAFWSALRRWGERAINAGILSVTDIRGCDPEACTLLAGRVTAGAVGGKPNPPQSVPVGPPERYYSSQEDLERLMAQAIAVRRR